jgi:hypothetical protein
VAWVHVSNMQYVFIIAGLIWFFSELGGSPESSQEIQEVIQQVEQAVDTRINEATACDEWCQQEKDT